MQSIQSKSVNQSIRIRDPFILGEGGGTPSVCSVRVAQIFYKKFLDSKSVNVQANQKACVRACVHVCVCACVRARVCAHMYASLVSLFPLHLMIYSGSLMSPKVYIYI